MKKRMPLLLFSLYSLTLFAQNLEYSAQFYSRSYGQRVIAMPNGKWFFAGKIYPGLWEEKEFTVIYGAIDQNSNLFPFSPIANQDNSNALSLFQKANGNILLGAEDIECGQANDGVVYEIDSEGEIEATYHLGMACRDFLDIKGYQGNIFASCAAGISQIFNDGNIVEKVTNVGTISAFIPLYNDWFLIGNSDPSTGFHGVKRIDEQNQTALTLDLSAGGKIQQMAACSFNKNIVLQRKNIYLVDDNLTILENLSVQNINIEFLRFTVAEDEIWVLGRDFNSNIIVYGFDTDLSLIENFSVSGIGLEALDLAVKDGQIALVGTGNSGMYVDTLVGVAGVFSAGRNFWIKTFETDGSGGFSAVDVGVEDVKMDEPTFSEMEYTCDGINMIQGQQAEIAGTQINITNHGSEILHHLVANIHIVACPASCNYDAETLIQETYENLNLAVGASVWLPFPNFEAIFHEYDLPQICLWLSTPNYKIDQNLEDNVFCKYFFDTSTPTNEIFRDFGAIIFPNPVDNVLNISLEAAFENDATMRIMNAVGQVLKETTLEKGALQKTIEMEDLQSGIYFLTIEKSNGITKTSKILKY